jgi:hypothetical protein
LLITQYCHIFAVIIMLHYHSNPDCKPKGTSLDFTPAQWFTPNDVLNNQTLCGLGGRTNDELTETDIRTINGETTRGETNRYSAFSLWMDRQCKRLVKALYNNA